jgi:hypothetical protein
MGIGRQVEKELAQIGRLKPNWDGCGSPGIHPDILAAARTLISSLEAKGAVAPLCNVVPVPGGTLQLEWYEGARSLEIEIEDARTLHYLKWDPLEGVREEDTVGITEIDRCLDLLDWFTRTVREANRDFGMTFCRDSRHYDDTWRTVTPVLRAV